MDRINNVSKNSEWSLLGVTRLPNNTKLKNPKMKGRKWTISYEDFYSDILPKKKLIKESPDALVLNGKTIIRQYGDTFMVFKTADDSKIYIAVTSGKGADFSVKVNNTDLTQIAKHLEPEFCDQYMGHEDLAELLHKLKSSIIKKDASREDFLLSGRHWKVQGVDYVSMWNSKATVEKYKEYFIKVLKLMNVSIDKCLFEFPGNENQGKYRSYNDSSLKSDVNQEKELMKKQHLDPNAKKILRQLSSGDSDGNALQKAADKLGMPAIKLKQLVSQGD